MSLEFLKMYKTRNFSKKRIGSKFDGGYVILNNLVNYDLFLYCGINLRIFKLPVQTQAAFWFMLFNWIECNNYSITIGPEKRKTLAEYYSRSDDPSSRSVQCYSVYKYT